MRPMQLTGPLHDRPLGSRHATRGDQSAYVSLASLFVTFVAIGLAVVSFGVLSLPPAGIAMLLARSARHELRHDSAEPHGHLPRSPGG